MENVFKTYSDFFPYFNYSDSHCEPLIVISLLILISTYKETYRFYLMITDFNVFCFRKSHMPSRKLLEQCQKLDKLWSHIFTTTFSLDEGTNEAIWYSKVTELIEKQQTSPIWMSESKVI